MSYNKLGFTSGQTLKAEHLNHMEDGIANAGGGVSLYEHHLCISGVTSYESTPKNISAYVNVITASETPITDQETLIQALLGGANDCKYFASGIASDTSEGRPKNYVISRVEAYKDPISIPAKYNISVVYTVFDSIANEFFYLNELNNMMTVSKITDNVRQIC